MTCQIIFHCLLPDCHCGAVFDDRRANGFLGAADRNQLSHNNYKQKSPLNQKLHKSPLNHKLHKPPLNQNSLRNALLLHGVSTRLWSADKEVKKHCSVCVAVVLLLSNCWPPGWIRKQTVDLHGESENKVLTSTVNQKTKCWPPGLSLIHIWRCRRAT